MIPRLVWVALLAGCSLSRGVAPLGKGHTALTTSFGGPVLNYGGAPVPTPIASVGVAGGVSDKTNLYGSVYVSSILLFGVPGFDLGAATQLVAPAGARPRVMGALTSHVFFGDLAEGPPSGGLRVWPDLQALGSWSIGPNERGSVWTGLDLLVQPAPTVAAFVSPLVGIEARPGRVGWRTELAWVRAFANNELGVPDWYGVAGTGAWSLKFGFDVHLGKEGRP